MTRGGVEDAVWRDSNGTCWSISEDVLVTDGIDPEGLPPFSHIVSSVTSEFESCTECINWSSSSSSSMSSSSSSMSSSRSSLSSSSSSQSSSSSSNTPLSSSSSMSSSSMSSSTSSTSSTSSLSSHSSHSSESTSNSGSSTSDPHDHHSDPHDHHYAGAGFIIESYSTEDQEALTQQWEPQMEGMTTEQKEDYLIDQVSMGNLSADQAIIIAVNMNMDMGA